MTIGEAIELVKNGGKVARKGWAKKFTYLFLHTSPKGTKQTLKISDEKGKEKAYAPKNDDLLAIDWERKG